MKAKVGADAMVPIASVFMLDIEDKMDSATMKKVPMLYFKQKIIVWISSVLSLHLLIDFLNRLVDNAKYRVERVFG